ncbi:MAG: DNA polymerase III subunit gamma/tau [Holosporales bacterium]|jgi:DNA polymerase-3 subunit gamma/tau|nr:DNA polymerase III subunit gamma/tau [Holosporales bacterium]
MEHVHKKRRRVLAVKYRPKVLSDVIGQDVLVQSLTKGIANFHLPQAILLHGIRGTGKTSTARILARAVNCTNLCTNKYEPCGVCSSCKAIDDDRHPDVLEMDAASHTGVDDIREVIDSAQYKAILGQYKIFIIDEVHMLSKSAFNALLKTLEEPPSHALFIFATTEINKIPETILSRCARFDLKRVDSCLLMTHFKTIAHKEGYSIEQDALAILVRTADGSVRDGLTLLDQAMNLADAGNQTLISNEIVQSMTCAADRNKLYVLLSKIINKQPEQVIQDTREVISQGADPVAIMQDLMECLYRVACFKITPKLSNDITIPEFERKIARDTASSIESMQILSLWKKMLCGYEDVKKSPFAWQALEMVLLRLCFAATIPSLENFMTANDGQYAALNDGQYAALNDDNDVHGFGKIDPRSAEMQLEQESSRSENAIQSCSESLCAVSKYKDEERVGYNEKSKNVCNTIEDLLSVLKQKREALLLSYVTRDVAFVSFDFGKIIVQIKNKDTEKIIPLLKQFLFEYTGIKWSIDIDKSSRNLLSIHEEQNEAQIKKEQQLLQRPFLKSVQKEFPGTIIEFIKK